MKIEKKDLKKSKWQLKITLTPEELVPYFKKSYDKFSVGVKIDGFRPGRAPRKMVEESLGQARLLSDGIDLALQECYISAINQEKLIPVSAPKVSISTYPSWGLSPEEIGVNLEFEVEIEVMPEVSFGDYSKISVKRKKVDEIKKDDVEKILTHLRRQKATFSEIDRSAKVGDRAEISYEGSVDNVKKEAMTAKNHPLVIGDGTLIFGFEQNLVGMKTGEEKEFEINFPKNYHSKEFAGKTAKFKVKIIDLKEIKLPELDEKFAADFGHKNLTDLKSAIEKSLCQEIEDKNKSETENAVIEKLLPLLKVVVPEALIDQEVARLISDIEAGAKNRGIPFEKYLESIKKTYAEIQADLRPVAEKNIRIGFLLGKIIEAEKLDPKNKEAGRKALDILVKKLAK